MTRTRWLIAAAALSAALAACNVAADNNAARQAEATAHAGAVPPDRV